MAHHSKVSQHKASSQVIGAAPEATSSARRFSFYGNFQKMRSREYRRVTSAPSRHNEGGEGNDHPQPYRSPASSPNLQVLSFCRRRQTKRRACTLFRTERRFFLPEDGAGHPATDAWATWSRARRREVGEIGETPPPIFWKLPATLMYAQRVTYDGIRVKSESDRLE